MCENVTLDEIADLETDIWGLPYKGQRTLFDGALYSMSEKLKQNIQRDTWIAEGIAIHSGRSEDECTRLAEAVKDLAEERGVKSLSDLHELHSAIHEPYFELMNERRERRDERHRQIREEQ